MNEDTYPPETIELIYLEVKDRLITQFQSVDSLDTKASIVIGFAGVIIGISLNLYPHGNPYLFGSSMTLFLISIAFSFAAYKIESYRRDPEPSVTTI